MGRTRTGSHRRCNYRKPVPVPLNGCSAAKWCDSTLNRVTDRTSLAHLETNKQTYNGGFLPSSGSERITAAAACRRRLLTAGCAARWTIAAWRPSLGNPDSWPRVGRHQGNRSRCLALLGSGQRFKCTFAAIIVSPSATNNSFIREMLEALVIMELSTQDPTSLETWDKRKATPCFKDFCHRAATLY